MYYRYPCIDLCCRDGRYHINKLRYVYLLAGQRYLDQRSSSLFRNQKRMGNRLDIVEEELLSCKNSYVTYELIENRFEFYIYRQSKKHIRLTFTSYCNVDRSFLLSILTVFGIFYYKIIRRPSIIPDFAI